MGFSSANVADERVFRRYRTLARGLALCTVHGSVTFADLWDGLLGPDVITLGLTLSSTIISPVRSR
jgi:hypothetical protein